MQANNLRKGAAIIYNGQVFMVTEVTHRTPGNKRAFVQVTLKEVKTGRLLQNKFSSGEEVEVADLESRHVQYLYNDQDGFHFMDMEDYQSFAISADIIGDQKYYLKENCELDIEFHEGKPIVLDLPAHIFVKVTDSPPGVKGDSVSNTLKTAVVETGLKVQVPLFISEGTEIKVDTRTGEYLGRK